MSDKRANIIAIKSYAFALNILKLCKSVINCKKEFVLMKHYKNN